MISILHQRLGGSWLRLSIKSRNKSSKQRSSVKKQQYYIIIHINILFRSRYGLIVIYSIILQYIIQPITIFGFFFQCPLFVFWGAELKNLDNFFCIIVTFWDNQLFVSFDVAVANEFCFSLAIYRFYLHIQILFSLLISEVILKRFLKNGFKINIIQFSFQ